MTRLFSANAGAIINDLVNNFYGCRIETGQYTGDGTVDQYIQGIGFQPRYVEIWVHLQFGTTETNLLMDQMVVGRSLIERFNVLSLNLNLVIALDADGFHVDDAGANSRPNTLNEVYDFICLG